MMRVLALDVGERRIGVALSDPSGTVARPLCTVERGSRAEDFAAIAELVAEQEVELVVVGWPLTLRGESGPQAQRVEEYARALDEALPVPLRMWDERYSTLSAEEIMRRFREGGRRRSRGGPGVDAVAAAVILQAFLDSQVMDRGKGNGEGRG
ncbi:MAG: Holliday junction resolvase RuvX [Anaerolineae bacterium]|jgi:putative Holliday junction resolvase